MNKETLIALIEKDIDELKTLTRGFSEMNEFPQPLLDLAAAKADNLRCNLLQLPHATVAAPVENIEPEPLAEPIPAPTVEAPTPEPTVEPEPELPDPEPIVEPEPEPIAESAPQPAEPESEPEPESEEDAAPAPAAEPHTIVAETLAKKETVVDEFEKKDDESLAHAIASKPVTDLKQAISIADRFRFQRELFANNGEAMIRALDALNACTTFSEAEQYIESHLHLPADNPATTDFVELVHRKFN